MRECYTSQNQVGPSLGGLAPASVALYGKHNKGHPQVCQEILLRPEVLLRSVV